MFKCERRMCWNKQTLYVTKEKEFCNCISATLHKLPFRVPKNVRTASQVGSWEAKELLSRVQQAENTSLSPTWKGFLLKNKFSECAVKKNAWAFSSFARILLIRQLQQDSQMNKPQQMHIMHIEMMTPEGKKRASSYQFGWVAMCYGFSLTDPRWPPSWRRCWSVSSCCPHQRCPLPCPTGYRRSSPACTCPHRCWCS